MDSERRGNGEGIALNKLGDIEEVTSRSGKVIRPINMNHYAAKKSAAQSMLDVALLMANSSQLKTVLYVGPNYPDVVFALVPAVKYDLNDVRKHAKLNTMNNVATVFVFFTVLINIFITALGFEGHAVSTAASAALSIPESQFSPLPLPIDLNTTNGI
ncbi:hypothetical protein L3Q82_003351 [Scortum barcoo]|uniref:Uncharacterized protein n=1 Tax=Scortum barcoo TaxID=214431 RepID=A0ACB8VR14_9TELE|nr:hypothetical protein L3Q82_003351 [Scortum barcoo]